ncbi:hypothetical protein K469DRAFT_629860 [Zopfia rhizophila CBS 207.26]|uniref:Mucin n=1 Tax=Zopfia rhizophila CBS 207.26 TaxID=1314779 RepID=A0A6A6E5C9_9PEZI|nr:hypothetical protein K469DRAFT_629860 [Zopfia rhizophila CBS 207.26]
MRGKKPSAPLTPAAEYAGLPLSVQRKYFSSLERLRIAEHLLQYPPQLHTSPRLAHHTPSNALHHSLTVASARKRLRKPESVLREHNISQIEAQWFLSLPEKVRRRHFSREEQALLAGRGENSILYPSEDQFFSRANPSLANFRFGFSNDSDSTPGRGSSRRRSTSVSPLDSLSQEEEEDAETEESLLYLDMMSSPTSQQALPPSTSFRRTLSLTNMTFRHSTSSAPPIASPPPFSNRSQSWRPRASSQTHSISGRRSSHIPVAPVFDPEATHYQDPEARKKLRTYLSSPQKFDEAVEFGFPSTAGNDSAPPRYQLPPITTDARNFSRDMQTFLRDDKMSFLEDDDEDAAADSDEESITDLESPVTPSSTGLSFRSHTRHLSSNFSSMDSTGLPPMHPMQARLNREMTLRMTLTRPDLRADEEHLYGWRAHRGSRDDPFALEELHLSDDMTGSKGAFAVKPKTHGGLVSRLFKRATKKGPR